MSTAAKDWKAVVRDLIAREGWTQERAVRKAADWADDHYPGERGLGTSNLSKRLSPGDTPKYGVDPRIYEAFAGAFGEDPSIFIEYRIRTLPLQDAADALAAFEQFSRPVTEVAAAAARRRGGPTE